MNSNFYSAEQISLMVDCIESDENLTNSIIRSLVHSHRPSAIEDARAMQFWWDTVAIPKKERGELKGNKKDIIAEEFGVSSGSVSKKLSLLKLVPELQDMIKVSGVNYVAFLPVAQKTEEEQKEFCDKIKDISVEELTLPNIKAILGEKIEKKKERSVWKEESDMTEENVEGYLSLLPYSKKLTKIKREKFRYLLRRL